MTFIDYLECLYNDMPHEVYIISAVMLIVGSCFFLYIQGHKKGWHSTMILLTMIYIFLFLGSTVLFRQTLKPREFDFTPLWSYAKILNGDETGLIYENLMNIVVFVPLGFLLGATWQALGIKHVIGLGCLLSVLIEAIQFMLAKGFSEIDDIINNTLGCVIGYGIYSLIMKTRNYLTNYFGANLVRCYKKSCVNIN